MDRIHHAEDSGVGADPDDRTHAGNDSPQHMAGPIKLPLPPVFLTRSIELTLGKNSYLKLRLN
jgi:hypothetical protein